jgi:5-aminopentanamidase
MKVAAYQAPLLPSGSMAAIELIREQVKRCESENVAILCCPEAALGGLADYASPPFDFAMDVEKGQVAAVLAPLVSTSVTSIVGFTEIAGGKLYNAAAVFQNGDVVGVYRKVHPAIHRSVYDPGNQIPVFTVGGLKFGIVICHDSNFTEPARTLVEQGAAALFVPTNNGMLENRGGAELVALARSCDIRTAVEHHVSVIRADVSGRSGNLISYGCSAIVGAGGRVLESAPPFSETLVIAEIEAGSADSRTISCPTLAKIGTGRVWV